MSHIITHTQLTVALYIRRLSHNIPIPRYTKYHFKNAIKYRYYKGQKKPCRKSKQISYHYYSLNKNQPSFRLNFPWNLANFGVKRSPLINHPIREILHFTNQKPHFNATTSLREGWS